MSKPSSAHSHSRRTFIGFGLAAAAGAATPRIRAASPNGKLNVAIIGCGGRGASNMGNVQSENIFALCDTNKTELAKAAKKHPKAQTTTDWRKLIENKGIDAFVVSTADHHHALVSLAAMRAGKHVYSEKPLAHTVQEARWMQEEYLKHKGKIATQMGTQIHATDNYRRTVELVRAGAVGQIREAHVWCSRTIRGVDKAKLPAQPTSDTLDWDVWQGPAVDRPYNVGYWKGGNLNWNRRWEFGNGVLGDMGSHLIDLPWWALELKRPDGVMSEGTAADPIAAPPSQICTWTHPEAHVGGGKRGAVKVIWYHGPEGMKRRSDILQPLVGDATVINKWGIGVAFVGERGVLVSDYVKNVLGPKDKFQGYQAPPQSIAKSKGHHREWIEACKGQGETLCNFDYSGSLIEHNLLGNVAHRAGVGKQFNWDAKNLKITNDEAANKFLSKEYREGWQVG